VQETPEQKLRSTILKLGEVVCWTEQNQNVAPILTRELSCQDPVQELHRVAKFIYDHPVGIPFVAECIRVGYVTVSHPMGLSFPVKAVS